MTETAPIGHNNPPADDKFLSKIATQVKSVGRRLTDQKALATASKKTREDWFTFGSLLADARQVIPSTNMFNAWLKDNDLEQFADRNSRTDAMWLCNLTDDMMEIVPVDLHSPKAIRGWYRKSIKEAVAASDGDMTEAGKLEECAAFVNAMNADDWDLYKAKYEADKDKVPFAQLPAGDAAAKVLAKIVLHDYPGDLWASLVKLVEAGGLDPEPVEEAPANDPEGDDDFDDDFPNDEVDADDDQ